ncbi:MAG: DUF5668 domain-containing protein [bacterium]
MNNKNHRFLGIALIVLGALFILNRVGIWQIDVFFDGWWTLFLIIPGVYYMTKQGIQVGNTILVGLGVFFLLDARGWDLTRYVMPAALVLLGIALIFKK